MTLASDPGQPAPEPKKFADPSGSPWPRGHRFADRTRANHATVQELLAAGLSRRAIGRQLRMTSRTVKLLADAASPEDLFQGQWQGRPSKLDAFKPYLDDRWNQGCTNAWRVWEEIVPLGYQGSYQRVAPISGRSGSRQGRHGSATVTPGRRWMDPPPTGDPH
ncbi:hypothetical protein [Kitasatospora sp. RG8]|uniref:hypothetical protein n=1 Tax=Kitasatospora sp. RG8 TaxID=2820815 RepID=UPI001FD7E5D7|nr:hypothetical protein [Kitasatospora sp. RG8]